MKRRRKNMSPTVRMKAVKMKPDEISSKLLLTIDTAISKIHSIKNYVKMLSLDVSTDEINEFYFYLEDLHVTTEEYMEELEE